MTWLRQTGDGVALTVRVVPRASATELAGVAGEALRIRLQAPPADGKANAALVAFLARALGVPRGAVTLKAGLSSRTKQVRVRGVTASAAGAALLGTG